MLPTASPSRSLPPAASKLESPGASSPKSTAVRKGSAAAATQAAERAFTQEPSLPLQSDGGADAGDHRGRRRLSGAFFIELIRIRPDPTQPRKNLDSDSQRDLTNSVRQLGLLQPITVRYLAEEEVYQIISGERRYQASVAAGLREVPCWIQDPKDHEVLLRQIVENWQRADLQPFELADALARLRDANHYSQRQLADVTGKSEGEISKFLALLRMDPAVQQQAREHAGNELSRRHLYAVSALDSEGQREILQTVVERKLSAADTEKMVATRKANRSGMKRPPAPPARFTYCTTDATVTVTFRRTDANASDALAALDDARRQAVDRAEPELVIHRPGQPKAA